MLIQFVPSLPECYCWVFYKKNNYKIKFLFKCYRNYDIKRYYGKLYFRIYDDHIMSIV